MCYMSFKAIIVPYICDVKKESDMEKDSIYLLTGASGFLGGTICRQLVDAGKKVSTIVLPGDKAARYIPVGVKVIEGDLCNPDDISRFFDVEDGLKVYVIHCASIVTVNPDYNPKVMEVNVGGTRNIIEACRSCKGFRKLVYVGSTGAMPVLPKGTVHKEIMRFSPELIGDCYGKSKAEASNLVLDAAQKDLDACIVMPTGIMGPGDNSISTTTGTVLRILKGEMSMGIAGSFNMADVRDLAAGVIAALEKGRRGETYILGNEAVSFRTFSRILSDESGCGRIRFFLPCGIARKIASFMEKKAARNGTRPLLTTYSIDVLDRNNEYDSSKAKKELGYSSRTYRETLRDEVAWIKAQGLLD